MGSEVLLTFTGRSSPPASIWSAMADSASDYLLSDYLLSAGRAREESRASSSSTPWKLPASAIR